MKRQKGYSNTELLVTAVFLVILVGWIKNVIKLSECDFEAPYKAEVIHIIGLLPPAGMVTGWLNPGK